MTTGDELIRQHDHWMQNASARLAAIYGGDSDDAYQQLAMQILLGRSHRVAWLKVRRAINKARPTVGRANRMMGWLALDDFEIRASLSDLRERLTEDEFEVACLRIEGRTQAEIGKTIGVSQDTISRMIATIREKMDK